MLVRHLLSTSRFGGGKKTSSGSSSSSTPATSTPTIAANSVTRPASEDDENIRVWLMTMLQELQLPGFSKNFAANRSCMTYLLKLVRESAPAPTLNSSSSTTTSTSLFSSNFVMDDELDDPFSSAKSGSRLGRKRRQRRRRLLLTSSPPSSPASSKSKNDKDEEEKGKDRRQETDETKITASSKERSNVPIFGYGLYETLRRIEEAADGEEDMIQAMIDPSSTSNNRRLKSKSNNNQSSSLGSASFTANLMKDLARDPHDHSSAVLLQSLLIDPAPSAW